MLHDDFMKHFRWITPLLLAFSVYLLQDMYLDFKKLKSDVSSLQMDVIAVKTYLTQRIDR